MDKRFDFEFRPFPGEKFTTDAHLTTIGAPVSLRNVVIGHVTKSRIDENGELVLTVEQE